MDKYEKLACEILEDTCETDEIFDDYDLDLIESGYLDSFALLNIIVNIEEKMGIRLQPTDINKKDICTVNSFIEFLKNKDAK